MATLNSLSPAFSDMTNLTSFLSLFSFFFPYYKVVGKSKNQPNVKKVYLYDE